MIVKRNSAQQPAGVYLKIASRLVAMTFLNYFPARQTFTRLLWKVLWPPRSAKASGVVQLTLRPSGESEAQ